MVEIVYIILWVIIYNNFNHRRGIRHQIANRLLQTPQQMPIITINNNSGENIPINIYVKKVFIDGEWGGDVEISMITLVYTDICFNL